MIDFKTIALHLLSRSEEFLREWLPAGKINGQEWICGSLRGEEGESFSVNLKTGVWADFSGNDKGGDLISLYAAIHEIKQAKAAKILAEKLGIAGGSISPKEERPKPLKQWVALPHAPDGVAEPSMAHFHYKAPNARWCYRLATGEVVGWVGRYEKSDGGKEVIPVCWSRNTSNGEEKWSFLSFPKPRPLYGLVQLAESKPDTRVYIVEGEKCADALRTLGACVVTWAGGGKAVQYTDWTPLKGRKCTLWPDRDRKLYGERETKDAALVGAEMPWEKQPGYKAMQDVAAILHGLECAEVRIIQPPDGKPDGWDVADALSEGMGKEAILAICKSAPIHEPPKKKEPKPPVVIPSIADNSDSGEEENNRNSIQTEFWPFRILGHDKGSFYYLSLASKQIVELSARGHNKIELLQLADLQWWNDLFPGNEDGQPNWLFAANALIQFSLKRIFDPADIRGRGAWLDSGRVIYHAGTDILCDNQFHQLDKFKSKFVYQRGRKISVNLSKVADTKEAGRLLQLCKCLNLKNPLDAAILAGWLVCAPICGVLDWRPHIWITGASGTGKTWVLEHIIKKVLGNMALYVQSNTTEAGIRQTLKGDALALMFDEAETENKADAERLQRVVTLARQASRDSEGRIIKGTTSGTALDFIIRSCFCFSSIGVAATQRADISRITILELFSRHNADEAAAQFDALQAFWEVTAANQDWCESIRARSIMLAPVIAENSHIFATAASKHLGTQRDGDQIGALLAGAWSLLSEKPVTLETATSWCNEQNWSAYNHLGLDKDEQRAFAILMTAIVSHEDGLGNHKQSIAELINHALDFAASNRSGVKATLERYGIGVRKARIDIADSHPELKKIFSDTPFGGKWGDQFRRLQGAATVKTSHFHGLQLRATGIPLDYFTAKAEE